MEKYGQISITLGTLGVVISLIGLFPGIVGLEAAEGIGVLQVLVILLGFSILFTAAYLFAKQTFFAGQSTTLAQDIGIRLTMTGLIIAAAAGLADVLGFGTHVPAENYDRPLLGRLQALFFIGSIVLASAGVVVYTMFGPRSENNTDIPSHTGDDPGSNP